MALKVIGSGFGRTGTMSTKMALEQLGFGPCHHMVEVMGNPAQPALWKAILEGRPTDWNEVFEGYVSQVDWPGARVWQQTAAAFREAKVIHTERPEEDWWASFNTTIRKFFASHEQLDVPPHIHAIFDIMDPFVIGGTFGGLPDKATAIAAYRKNNQTVRDTIAADRLLVFTPADGWGPLCRFLDVPEPAGPFPRSNARDEFWAHFGGEPAD